MDLLTRYNLTPLKILKFLGIFIAAAFVLSFALSLITGSMGTLPGPMNRGVAQTDMAYPTSYDGDYYAKGESSAGYGGAAPSLSTRNVMPIYPSPMPGGVSGNDAEEFEVTDYSASIETRNAERDCAKVADLKAKEYVIFESSNTYDRGCNFSFKVEHSRADEILAAIRALDPKQLSENSYTIKRQIDDFTSETDILKRKLTSIDETMRSAIAAYDEITRIATQSRDAQSLSTIIDSRIQLIERLTMERINISEQLARYERAKADELDRLEYTFFRVDVSENKFVDGEQLKESWKAAVRDVVRVINQSIQGISINLIAFLFIALQFILYGLLLLLAAKYGWQLVKRIWNR